jgi:hypothetical protein
MKDKNTLCWLTIFSIAMGFLEAIVVVYLREIYYPDGFEFPLQWIPKQIYITELIREICTLVMLVSVAWIIGKNFLQRMSWFLLAFGVWDIFYYVALKIFLNWPVSFFTWDILFLIPVTWLGPVLSPIICSGFMIILSVSILLNLSVSSSFKLMKFDWLLLLIGFGVIFISFIWNYVKLILSGGFLMTFLRFDDDEILRSIILHYVPEKFQWGIFLAGIAVLTVVIIKNFHKYSARIK